ncbi:hypothetical protein [Nocardia salmonicida]|uniref:hypothetical protein n=1 Tax=Nocardia salmonicida TaxID=53431 RepID=UPI003CE8FBAC
MDQRTVYEVIVPARALSELIDAVHELVNYAPTRKARRDNITYLDKPGVTDLPVPRQRSGPWRAVAAIMVLLRQHPPVEVVFGLHGARASAEFWCRAGESEQVIDPTWPSELAKATAAALTARGITSHADRLVR